MTLFPSATYTSSSQGDKTRVSQTGYIESSIQNRVLDTQLHIPYDQSIGGKFPKLSNQVHVTGILMFAVSFGWN